MGSSGLSVPDVEVRQLYKRYVWMYLACPTPRGGLTALQTNRMCFAGLSNTSRRSASPTNETNGFRWSVRPHVEDRQLYER